MLPTHDAGTFNAGELPSIETKSVVTGIEKAIASEPEFTGTETLINATFEGTEVTHEVIDGKVSAVQADNIETNTVGVVLGYSNKTETKTITVQ